jgi:hypothetical protein
MAAAEAEEMLDFYYMSKAELRLMPLTDEQTDGEKEELEEGRKLHTTLAFMCGLGREGMPQDVFRFVMDLLMPSWDPLRRKNACAGPPLPQG